MASLDPRYLIVAGASVSQAVAVGGLFAYGVFFDALEGELGWSRTTLSASSSLAFFVMGALGIVAGRLNDRIGPRWVLSVAGAVYGLGYVLMSVVQAPWQLFVLFGLLIGVGLSAHDVSTLSTVAQWFVRRRGMMTGVVKVGTACGQIVVPLAASMLIASFGWRVASIVLGVGAGVLLLIAAQGLRRNPAVQLARSSDSLVRAHGMGLSGALRTRQLWILAGAQFAFLSSLATIPVHLPVHGADLGLTPTKAASLLSVVGALSIAGRLGVGFTADRIGGRRALLVCFCVLLVSLLWLKTASAPWMLYLFAAVYGFAHGGFFTVVSPTVAEYFGMANHGAIFGVILFFGTIGGALGPLIAGAIFDELGSYDAAFTVLAVLAFIGGVLALSLRPLTPRAD